MNIKKLCKNKKGFTLIEIIVVVVILAVLMAVAVPSVLKYIGEADNAKFQSQSRGAYIAAQAEITKAYIAKKEANYDVALVEAKKSLGESKPLVEKIEIFSDEAGKTKITTLEDPNKILSYRIYFNDAKKQALLTPNGEVKIEEYTPAP